MTVIAQTPFFSIITAAYNSAVTIEECILSLLDQHFTDFEFIVVDGLSSDNTIDIVAALAEKFREKQISFKYISEKDNGIYDAWNKGIRLSRGQWIAFLGSDDAYTDGALKQYFDHIAKAGTDCNYISSKVVLVNDKDEALQVVGKPFVWKNLVRNMDIAQVGSFHHKTLFEKVGLFNDAYKIVGDLEFYIRCKDHIRPAYFDAVTAKMRNGGVSNQIYKALHEALRVKLAMKSTPKLVSYYDFYLSLLKSYIKVLIKKK